MSSGGYHFYISIIVHWVKPLQIQICLTFVPNIHFEENIGFSHRHVVITNEPDAIPWMCQLLLQLWLKSRHVRVQILYVLDLLVKQNMFFMDDVVQGN